MRSVVALIVLLKLSATTVGLAQHWPNWRGPTHDGVSAEKNLPGHVERGVCCLR
jgi:hypothetical protein